METTEIVQMLREYALAASMSEDRDYDLEHALEAAADSMTGMLHHIKDLEARLASQERALGVAVQGINQAKTELWKPDYHSDFGHLCEVVGDAYTALERALTQIEGEGEK